jgi:hypothetical protein
MERGGIKEKGGVTAYYKTIKPKKPITTEDDRSG